MKMTGLWNDARFALRGLLRAPGFTVITVGTLALGIGAMTAIFTVVNGVLLKPLPFENPILVPVREVHGVAQRHVVYTRARRRMPDAHEPVRIVEGKRLE